MEKINIHAKPDLSNDVINELFFNAWENHQWKDFMPILDKSLVYIGAFSATKLIGFVNIAWDGGSHAFLLDTTVHMDWQRRGIGKRIIENAIAITREHGVEWIHVDYESRYKDFYTACGFFATNAGLIYLKA